MVYKYCLLFNCLALNWRVWGMAHRSSRGWGLGINGTENTFRGKPCKISILGHL